MPGLARDVMRDHFQVRFDQTADIPSELSVWGVVQIHTAGLVAPMLDPPEQSRMFNINFSCEMSQEARDLSIPSVRTLFVPI